MILRAARCFVEPISHRGAKFIIMTGCLYEIGNLQVGLTK